MSGVRGMIRPLKPLAERFWAKVDRRGPDECWLWTGCDGGEYGQIHLGQRRRKMVSAHRVSYELAHGVKPGGLNVLHRCDTPRCVNPAHLFLGTAKDNAEDCVAKGRHSMKSRARCPQGHEYTTENTIRNGRQGARRCRTCHAEKERARHARKRWAEMQAIQRGEREGLPPKQSPTKGNEHGNQD